MNIENKQKLFFLKKIFSNKRKRISLFVSVCLMLILSSVIIFSLFLSELTLEKIGQSNYFQTKVSEALKQNEISPEGLASIKFSKFGRAEISIERAIFSNISDLVAHNINLKVDFIKYWFGLNFIDQVSITKLTFSLRNNSTVNLYEMNRLDLGFLTRYVYEPISKINSKSIYIENGVLKFRSQIYDFKKIYLVKNEKLLTAKARLDFKQSGRETTFSANVNMSLNDTNIFKFNIGIEEESYIDNFYFEKLPKIARLFLGRLTQDKVLSNEKSNEISLVGTYDLNSAMLKFKLSRPSRLLEFTSTLNISKYFENRSLLFLNAKLVSRDLSLFLSEYNINLSNQTFETKVKQILKSDTTAFDFLDDLSIKGAFHGSGSIKTKINIFSETDPNLRATVEIDESTNGIDTEDVFFDIFVRLDTFKKKDFNEFRSLLDLYPIEKDIGIKISNANAQIRLKFGRQHAELTSFEGNIKDLVYLRNGNPLHEVKNIDFKGNLKRGYANINSVTTVSTQKNLYRDIKVEFSVASNFDSEREVALTFKSTVNNLISLTPMAKNDLAWIDFLAHSQGEKEVEVTYSRVLAINEIDKFFSLEKSIFELNIKNLLIPIDTKKTVNLATFKIKSIGSTIFFDGIIAANDKKISGSVANWRFNIFDRDRTDDLIIFIDNLNSEALFPEFSTFRIKGPIKLTFLPIRKDDNTFIRSNIDLTMANVYIPSLALKKKEGSKGQFVFNYRKDKKSSFQYSQNGVSVSGLASHKSIFEINKVNYTNIKTPDIRIKKATFQKFGTYNRFKTNKGVINLDFLMSLKFERKKIPLDLIFSDIVLNFNEKIFLDSVKGEIRSFEGLRGYAKAKLSPQSNLEVIISPHDDSAIKLVISGNDAGELLRRGDYYRNGYGGMFKASVSYKNKRKIAGSLEIQDFRVKNAPVLAQIISSASIIGLLDNLNGNGLLFTKIEGSFDYRGDELTLKDGVAVGPSLGLTMGGYERYGEKENVVDVNGLVSPVYIINGVVKAIPFIGKVLGGEKGEGVFGVSYKVQGNSRNPRVLVNPLSILTPGVFRKIFSIENKW